MTKSQGDRIPVPKTEEINSYDYWDRRFSTGDWDKYDEDAQTAFFAENAIDALPAWLRSELLDSPLEISDLGCAEGAATALLAYRFPLCSVMGTDCSEAAVEKAQKKYPGCTFAVSDITAPIPETDVIFCSNVLEHMRNPLQLLEHMLASARRHGIFVLPYRDQLGHAEHFRAFDEHFFPLKTQRHHLSYFRIIDCERMHSPCWPGEQILVVYSDDILYPQDRMRLSGLFENTEYEAIKHQAHEDRLEFDTKLSESALQLNNLEMAVSSAQSESSRYQAKCQQLQSELERSVADHKALSVQLDALQQERDDLSDQYTALQQEIQTLTDRLAQLSGAKSELSLQFYAEQNKTAQALKQLYAMASSRLFRVVHLFNRVLRQGFSSQRSERRLFRKWLSGRFRHIPDRDHRYNPLFSVIYLLEQESVAALAEEVPAAPLTYAPLTVAYNKPDVIILSIIDYSFRHQRPQHFAQRFARSGHRVYYVNANFGTEYINKSLENGLREIIFPNSGEAASIYLTDWSNSPAHMKDCLDTLVREECIRDAFVVVDYPNWVHAAEYLKSRYGFHSVTDYMDDFTGFLNPAEEVVKRNCIRLMQSCDGVVASSQFLYEIARKYKDQVTIDRNGTEFDYFHQSFGKVPTRERKIIGYYGAIAEWFQADLVCRCAERFPDCEILLVGNVTAHRQKLQQYNNISLTGEVAYRELLPYLEQFDVCLIPFDATTDLIKATNPVKFYEYLSAGKKVVATEIPELVPYRDKYVYLENDPERFCDRVADCLAGRDTLASPEECAAFARENDWDARARVFLEAMYDVCPKISVVILCYNQLEYTKRCVESIFFHTAYPNYELILVDNQSTDGTADWLKELAAGHKNVKLVLNDTNRGFAGGNNDGLAVAEGDYLVLLNNDTLVTRGWLTGLLKHFQDKTVGMVGPVTNSIGNDAQIPVNYNDVADMPAFAYAYTLQHMGEEYPHDGVLAMFCVMISRTLYQRLGPLDEHYGIGMFEDDDYSMASVRAGFRNIMAEDVFIHHFGSVSFKKLGDEKYMALFQKNRQYFNEKWSTTWKEHHYRPGVSL